MKRYLLIGAVVAVIAIAAAFFVRTISPGQAAQSSKASITDTARPAVFTQATAMLAIFGAYNDQHNGTLIPVKSTKAWRMRDAEILATPIIAATYEEGTQRKGVLAVQRQIIHEGEIEGSHATPAGISVYVFSFDGNKWIFDKGKKSVVEAGAHGYAPDGRLVRVGDAKYGLLFEGGDIHQGYTNDYMFLIAISEPVIHVVLQQDTGETNSGACSDDEKEIAQSDGLIQECWGHEAKIAFLRSDDSNYYTIRVTDVGTARGGEDNSLIPFRQITYFTMTSDGFKPTSEPRHQAGQQISDKVIYDVGSSSTREMTMPTIPRRLLK